MQEASIWFVVIGLIALMIWGLTHENKRQRNRTTEEFERDAAGSRNALMRAGMLELDRLFGERNQKTAAVERLKDERQGMVKTGGKSDDADRTESSTTNGEG
jgi:hypothetical protein